MTSVQTAEDQVVRTRVLLGEDESPERRGTKVRVARSDCSYFCPDAATLQRCIEALRESDERLRNRPEEMMLWDWAATWMESATDGSGGGTVFLGVSWYDMDFFNERRDAWFGTMHRHAYQKIGVPMENIKVTHWIALEP